MTITLYAELLLNIRQMAISISLQSPTDHTTHLQLSPDHTVLVVRHGGRQSSLKLPMKVADASLIRLPTEPTTEISLRISAGPLIKAGIAARQAEPWSARALTGTRQLACMTCGSALLAADRIQTWKDLPAENWAEMMELWHCHKPDPISHDQQDESSSNGKAYGASSKFTAQTGVAFVGVNSVLLSPEDCGGMELWIFTPDMYYSSSLGQDGPRRAMKVLFQVSREQREEPDVEELHLPLDMAQELLGLLELTNQFLPASTRRLQSWNVGLLKRFDD
ncbi:MAG: hypothetical protein M1826_003592 [Phylliscum demangeonii]|nr:MAG: hypothetical protein M1826_003592 [Phylliscum demangeonii]